MCVRGAIGRGTKQAGLLDRGFRVALLIAFLFGGLLLAAGAAAAQESTTGPVTYTVQPGDTLFNIAQRFGTTVDAIAEANGISNPALIEAGQKLVIPAAEPEPERAAPRTYVVQPGDTLFGIARAFGSTVKAIAGANDIPDPSYLEVGQRLVIPEAPAEPEQAFLSARRVHQVQEGETLPFLALRYGTTVWALRRSNELDWLGLVLPGQELEIPPAIVAGPATPRFPSVSTAPEDVLQGQTVVIKVHSPDDLALGGSFLGQALPFLGEPGAYWALAGVDALTQPGEYTLTLEAVEQETGDRLLLEKAVRVEAGVFATVNIAVPADRMGLLDADVSQAESFAVSQVLGQMTSVQQWHGVFGYPLMGATTTAGFGQRRSYAGGPVSGYHSGQDMGAAAGTPVYAPAAGTVALAEALQVRGNAIIVDHGLGVMTGFWHLSNIHVVPGQVVARGELLGLVGNTGLSTGPHLHWQMDVRGVPVDPVQWTRQVVP